MISISLSLFSRQSSSLRSKCASRKAIHFWVGKRQKINFILSDKFPQFSGLFFSPPRSPPPPTSQSPFSRRTAQFLNNFPLTNYSESIKSTLFRFKYTDLTLFVCNLSFLAHFVSEKFSQKYFSFLKRAENNFPTRQSLHFPLNIFVVPP